MGDWRMAVASTQENNFEGLDMKLLKILQLKMMNAI